MQQAARGEFKARSSSCEPHRTANRKSHAGDRRRLILHVSLVPHLFVLKFLEGMGILISRNNAHNFFCASCRAVAKPRTLTDVDFSAQSKHEQ